MTNHRTSSDFNTVLVACHVNCKKLMESFNDDKDVSVTFSWSLDMKSSSDHESPHLPKEHASEPFTLKEINFTELFSSFYITSTVETFDNRLFFNDNVRLKLKVFNTHGLNTPLATGTCKLSNFVVSSKFNGFSLQVYNENSKNFSEVDIKYVSIPRWTLIDGGVAGCLVHDENLRNERFTLVNLNSNDVDFVDENDAQRKIIEAILNSMLENGGINTSESLDIEKLSAFNDPSIDYLLKHPFVGKLLSLPLDNDEGNLNSHETTSVDDKGFQDHLYNTSLNPFLQRTTTATTAISSSPSIVNTQYIDINETNNMITTEIVEYNLDEVSLNLYECQTPSESPYDPQPTFDASWLEDSVMLDSYEMVKNMNYISDNGIDITTLDDYDYIYNCLENGNYILHCETSLLDYDKLCSDLRIISYLHSGYKSDYYDEIDAQLLNKSLNDARILKLLNKTLPTPEFLQYFIKYLNHYTGKGLYLASYIKIITDKQLETIKLKFNNYRNILAYLNIVLTLLIDELENLLIEDGTVKLDNNNDLWKLIDCTQTQNKKRGCIITLDNIKNIIYSIFCGR